MVMACVVHRLAMPARGGIDRARATIQHPERHADELDPRPAPLLAATPRAPHGTRLRVVHCHENDKRPLHLVLPLLLSLFCRGSPVEDCPGTP